MKKFHHTSQINFQWDDDEVCIVLDQHTELDFYSACSLKQQPMGRRVAHHTLSPEQIACYIDSCQKNNNLAAKKAKWFNLIQNTPSKIIWSSLWDYHW
jgi:hypothetical protein